MEETRRVKGMWNLVTYKWKFDGGGIELLKEGLKNRKILGVKCHQCGTVYVPGTDYCRKCFIDIQEIVEVGQTGELTTFTVGLSDIRGNPLEKVSINCTVKLDGADTHINGRLEGIDWHEVNVGMRVKVVWVNEPKGELKDIDHFEPL